MDLFLALLIRKRNTIPLLMSFKIKPTDFVSASFRFSAEVLCHFHDELRYRYKARKGSVQNQLFLRSRLLGMLKAI